MEFSARYYEAIARFDAANAADPNIETADGHSYPKELLYAQRMTAWLNKYQPDASEALHLAARAQHICRWKIPRKEYPMGRVGYNDWRTKLAKMHGELATGIMRETGYDEQMCERVRKLLMKDRMEAGEGEGEGEGQILEDVICLVFLEFYFVPFAPQYSEQKLAGIVRKTWRKMSQRGKQTALTLAPLWPPELLEIVKKAVG